MTDQDKYVFTRAGKPDELRRLRLIETIFDPATKEYLIRAGLEEGRYCLEIGPGAGSILRHMCVAVGAKGRVLAVDTDTQYIRDLKHANLTIKEGDIFHLKLPSQSFDIIHARYVLLHIPEYNALIRKLKSLLKPGGVLLIEDADFSTLAAGKCDDAAARSFNLVARAIDTMYRQMNIDPEFGKRLPDILKDHGFANIQAEGQILVGAGESNIAEVMRLSTQALRAKYLATKILSAEDIEHSFEYATNPLREAVYWSTISCWGTRASDES